MVRLNRMPLLGFLGLLGTMLVGCTDDSGINVTNNPVTDGSLPTNVTTVTDTAVTSATVTMTVTSSGTDTATTNTGTTTATGTKSGTDTATSTGTSTKTSTAVTTTVTATATAIITLTGTTSATSTTTYSATGGNVTVILSYPPAWSCPTNTATGVGGATGTAILPTDSTLSTTDCKSLANLRRPLLKAQSQSTLSSARNNLVYANCTGKTETRCLDKNGQQISMGYCPYGYAAGADAGVSYSAGGAMASAGSSGAPGIGGAAGSTGATEYSTTNTQVASVDEADYVKNDGNSIFVLAKDGLHVLDAWPAAETHEV